MNWLKNLSTTLVVSALLSLTLPACGLAEMSAYQISMRLLEIDYQTFAKSLRIAQKSLDFIDNPLTTPLSRADIDTIRFLTGQYINWLENNEEIRSGNDRLDAARTESPPLERVATSSPTPIGLSSSSLESQIINGTTAFISERLKEEVTLEFTLKMKFVFENESIFVSSDTNIYLSNLLPETMSLLNAFASDDGMLFVPDFGSLWRSAFQMDLQNLPKTISKFLPDDQRLRVKSGIEFVESIIRGSHPSIAIQKMDDIVQNANASDVKHTQQFTRISRIISNSILYEDGWIDADRLDKLYRDDDQSRLFIALVYWQLATDEKLKGIDALGLPQLDFTLYEKLKASIQQAQIHWAECQEEKKEIQSNLQYFREGKAGVVRPGMDQYARYVSIALNGIREAENIRLILVGDSLSDMEVNLLLKNLNQYNSFITAISLKNYGAAVSQAGAYIQEANTSKETPGKLDEKTKAQKRFQIFFRYASFLANIVDAKDSEQIKNAIHSAAVPAGGWRIKRRAGYSVTLNSYPGIGGGGEWIQKKSAGANTNWQKAQAVMGVACPVGIDVTWLPITTRWRGGVFASVADLGALLSYQVSPKDTAVSTEPNVTFRQIFSPGVYFVLHSPTIISLGVGVQMTPGLRNVELTGGSAMKANALRLGVFISLDVPLFSLYVKE